MAKIKESINSRISSKKYWRTFEQQSYRDELARNLKEFRKKWDKESMNKLLDEEIKSSVDVRDPYGGYEKWNDGKYLKSIQTLHGRKPTNALAKKLIQEWWAVVVLAQLDVFSWLDKEIWMKLACTSYEGGDGLKIYRPHSPASWIVDVMKHIDKFQWLDVNVLINEYVKRSKEYLKRYYDDSFRNSWIEELCSWISKYKWSNINKETAKMLIHNWASACITDYKRIDKFEWLDEEIANLLTAEGHWKFVKAHPEKFWLKNGK